MKTLLNKYTIFFFVIASFVALFAHAAVQYDFLNLKNNSAWVPEWTRAYDIIHAENAWDKIVSSSSSLSPVTIGIIDSGVDAAHQEFTVAGDLNNTVQFGSTPPSARKDSNGHGTGVAGIIGANNISANSSLPANSFQTNGILSGVLPVSKYTLEVRNIKGSTQLLFESLKNIYTTSELLHADVVNISRGEINSPVTSATAILYRLIFWHYSNTLFIFSAGNDGVNVENQTPANIHLANTITVGATDFFDKRYVSATTSSNFGAGVDISAPQPVFSPSSNNKYVLFDKTSASAPLVTGVAGLLKSIKPSLTPSDIKNILIRTADPIQTGETDKRLGKGCYTNPDDPINTGCRLNAYKAICDSQVGLNCPPPATAQYFGTTVGNPGIPGDGIIVTWNGGNFVFELQPDFPLRDIANGITVSVFPITDIPLQNLSLSVNVLSREQCAASAASDAAPIPLSVNGAAGIGINYSQNRLNAIASDIRNIPGCADISFRDLVITGFYLVDTTSTGGVRQLDAIAIGIGENAFPR